MKVHDLIKSKSLRIVAKTGFLFAIFNLLWAVLQPMQWLGGITLYQGGIKRNRLPFSEFPDASYNLSLFDMRQMLASHELARPKEANEFRVLHIGDSSVWGYVLSPHQTQAACLNEANLSLPDGRVVRVYNLGYPKLSVFKDLFILQAALDSQPDMIIWSITLASLYPGDQLDFPILRANYEAAAGLINRYGFQLPEWRLFTPPNFLERTFIGQRRQVADWVRYQLYAFGWAAGRDDHVLARFVAPHPNNLVPDSNLLSVNVVNLRQAGQIAPEDLSLDIIAAGFQLTQAAGVPMILVNQPVYRSESSELRLNTYYPRWAYEGYRATMLKTAEQRTWPYFDFWDVAPVDAFTDTDFHLNAAANCAFARDYLGPTVLKNATQGDQP
jgi:hypothetical protein